MARQYVNGDDRWFTVLSRVANAISYRFLEFNVDFP